MSRIHGFPPICAGAPRVLILGSMPSVASLQAFEYYAHPRNAFWPLVEALLGIKRTWPYADRSEALIRHSVAVWDVLASCERPGSLDAAIDPASVKANDLAGLLWDYPSINSLFFNGQMAETVFRRHQLDSLGNKAEWLQFSRLPSTSPANASWSFERKLDAWQQVKDALTLQRG